jgi:iron(III) transport system substrate-binding protein
MNQFHFHRTFLSALALLALLVSSGPAVAADQLVAYSGRAERLIKPVLDAFQAKTGIQVELLSSGTTELVNRLQAEGSRTAADVFLTNDAGSLARARELGLLLPLTSQEVEQAIPAAFRAPDNSWIGLSGRFWVIVYNTDLVKPSDLASLFDLADPKWKGKIGIPNAGSEYLQAGVSVISASQGDERAGRFLAGLRDNAGAQVYGKSSQIVEAVAKGQIALGVVNHYYIYRYLATQPTAPIAPLMTDQQDGGMGAIQNVAGIGVVKATKHLDAAKRLVEFLVSPEGQKLFADLNKEYPLRADVAPDPALPKRTSFRAATVPLARLSELREPAMALIEKTGLR